MSRVQRAQRILENPLLAELIDDYTSAQIAQWVSDRETDNLERYHHKVNAALDIRSHIENKCREIIKDGTSDE